MPIVKSFIQKSDTMPLLLTQKYGILYLMIENGVSI